MVTSSGYGAVSSVSSPASVYRAGQEKDRERRIQTASSRTQYDSVTLSSPRTGESRFQMEMASRLTQQVRTVTTTGDIASLRQQVSSGTYAPDAMNIAARMLLLGEGR